MKISYNWLQKYFKNPLPSPEIITDGIVFHAFEVESAEIINSHPKSDWVFDIKVLPDRAHDCLSHYGIARELSVILGQEMKPEFEDFFKLNLENKNAVSNSNLITIKNDACRRYIGRIINNVVVGPSPEWLKDSLMAIGQKSINNIVDATNYVMYDLGNPIHAFDADKISSYELFVDNALKDEKIILLDGKEIILDESVLTIRDGQGPLAIAGIKGGKKAEVDINTKNIIVEVANFDPILVRKTARRLGIFTDSAKRFENEISKELAGVVINKISDLIIELAGGELGEIVDVYKNKEEIRKISFTIKYINNLLGTDISKDEIENILNKFKYVYESNEDEYIITIPPLRLDLSSSQDIAEEIGRIYGYDKIVTELPKIDFLKKNDSMWLNEISVREKLVNEGYKEVMTYTFADKGEVEVLNIASDKKFLRTNLSDGIKKSYELNKLNTPLLGIDEVKIFEIGAIFLNNVEEIHICIADKKGIKEMKLEEFVSPEIHSESLAQADRDEQRNFSPEKYSCSFKEELSEEKKNKKFKMWSAYPFITRDIAVWVPENIKPEVLVEIYKEFGGELLVIEPKLFDQFTKNNKTSYAYRLVFQSNEKTLTDEEINKIMSNISEKIAFEGWEVR